MVSLDRHGPKLTCSLCLWRFPESLLLTKQRVSIGSKALANRRFSFVLKMHRSEKMMSGICLTSKEFIEIKCMTSLMLLRRLQNEQKPLGQLSFWGAPWRNLKIKWVPGPKNFENSFFKCPGHWNFSPSWIICQYHVHICNVLLVIRMFKIIALESKTNYLCVSHAWPGISLAFERECVKKISPANTEKPPNKTKDMRTFGFVYLRSEFRNENIRWGQKGVKYLQLHWWDFSTWIAFQTLYYKWHLIARKLKTELAH